MDFDSIEPYKTVQKDGFMGIDCVKDAMLEAGDAHGDGKLRYKMEQIANVSIIHYTDIIPKEDRKPMTQGRCFEFCRTVPDMLFFGINNGRDCYCAPILQAHGKRQFRVRRLLSGRRCHDVRRQV